MTIDPIDWWAVDRNTRPVGWIAGVQMRVSESVPRHLVAIVSESEVIGYRILEEDEELAG